MHTLCLFTLFTLLLPLSLSQTTFYIDETTKTNSTDGSRNNLFSSLDDAALSLKPGTFNIILLGQSITITSQVIFPSGSVCTISPQTIPESGYYPLKFDIGASIRIQQTNATFQNIQFVELDPDRGLLTSAIDVYCGFLFLNRTLVSDIQYQDFSYPFISAWNDLVTKTALFLVDSQFKNLRNVQIDTTMTQVTVQNTSFENLEMDEAFLTLWPGSSGEIVLRMFNISLVNGKFGVPHDLLSTGFVHVNESCVNVSLEGFSVKNVSIKNGAGLIAMTQNRDTPKYPTSVNIWDVTLEDIVEIEDEDEEPLGGIGLILHIEGPVELTVRNLTARNMQFKNSSLLTYIRYESTLPFSYESLSQISLQDIKINNSSNTNFLISSSDDGQVEDVELVNVSSKKSSVFSFEEVGTVSIKNIYGRNISDSVISLQHVFSQNLENLTFYNVSMTQENFLSDSQNLIQLTRYSNMTTEDGLTGQSTVITDFFIDGYEYTRAETKENKAYLMRIEAEIGTVLIRDSIWRNINTGGFLSHNMSALKVDNLSVNGVSEQAAEIFRFESFDSVKIANSRFENNENLGLVFVDVPEDAENMTMGLMISFENISVVKNNAKYKENSTSFPSNLFEFKSPKKAIQMYNPHCLFLFNDNEIAGSIIKISESHSVNVSLEGNTFVRNYAWGAGAIFSTDNMQENMSILTAKNNVFQANICWFNGGIFSFLDSWYQVLLTNNTYKNNTAAENGGIGQILRSTISFLEQDSFYSDNTAERDGGLWFIRSSNQLQNPQPPITFTNISFSNSLAGNNGGAFYLLDGNLIINSSLFNKSQAKQSGGVFYLEAFSSLFINGSVFQEITAPEGSLVFTASIGSPLIVMQGVSINNARASERAQRTLVNVNSGFVVVDNSVISGISGQLLFYLKGSTVKFDGARISDIDCSEVKEACVVNGESVNLEWEDTEVKDVVLQGDLVVLDEKSVEKGEVKTVNITKVE